MTYSSSSGEVDKYGVFTAGTREMCIRDRLAFAPDAGLTEQQALRVASSFGGGIGGMREVCGAVSGMLMAAGLLYGYEPGDRAGKSEHYARCLLYTSCVFTARVV